MIPIRVFLLILLIAVPSLASAQQAMNYEDASALLGASCGKDIDDNCRGVNLDPPRLKECFIRNGDSISAKCRDDYPRAVNAIQGRITARITLAKLCNWELNHLCGTVRQDPVKGLQCLLAATRSVTPNCNKAIIAAGFR
jgi:hypothetical protein